MVWNGNTTLNMLGLMSTKTQSGQTPLYVLYLHVLAPAWAILHFTVPGAILNSIKFAHGTEAGVEWFQVDSK